MLRSFWRSFDRFSLQHFQHVINELRGIEVIDTFNTEEVVDILQSIVEIVTYGDKHDPLIFECFMEHQVLAEFVRILKISSSSSIEAKVLQYLSILIQNLHNEHAIYYCFSNGHINNIITHDYDFSGGDLAVYFISFLRAVSGKLNKDTICLLLKFQEGAVTSFPLYTQALKFAHHGEKMIQTAIRSLTLSIYNVSDDTVCQFLMTPPVCVYFSDVVLKLREECVHLDTSACNLRNNFSSDKKKDLTFAIDKILDDLYYIKDLLSLGNSRLNVLVTHKLLGLLVVPMMIPLMQLGKHTGVKISALTSLYLLSHLIQVVDKKEILDSVASLILYPHVALGTVVATEEHVSDSNQVKPCSPHVDNIEQILFSSLESQVNDKVLEPKLSARHFTSFQLDNVQERIGILSYTSSDNEGLLLSSLMMLLILAESNAMDNLLALTFGFSHKKAEFSTRLNIGKENACCGYDFILWIGEFFHLRVGYAWKILPTFDGVFMTDEIVDSNVLNGNIFIKFVPQILNALLNILGRTTASSVLTQRHAAWFLLKFFDLQRSAVVHHNLHLFSVSVKLNTSFHHARERLLKELNGYWFDYTLDVLEKEWISCKSVLEESSRKKDPNFILEIAFCEQSSDEESIDAWQMMVDAVKIFVLHLQLKGYVLNGCIPQNPPIKSGFTSLPSSRSIYASDPSTANFGSEVALGSGIPCKIAFSKVGIRDIYLIPVAKGISGKLLLVEKHPFLSQTGIVLATAPLAGLTPKIDDKQETWLHLCIRDLNPKLTGKRSNLNSSKHKKDARWTLGFSDAKACEAASLLIAEETCKQRSFIESLLAPFLYDNYLCEEADTEIR